MGSITVSFSSDDPDEIACIVAFWELIQSELLDDEPSFVLVENYGRLYDIHQMGAGAVYKFLKEWDSKRAESLRRRFPDLFKAKSDGLGST